jgi:putative hydrolase of the HAD superfamily
MQAITFDAGGTLLEPWPSVGHVYAEVAREQQLGNWEPGELNRRFAAVWRDRSEFDYSRPAWARLVSRTFEHLTPQADDPHLFEALWQRFAETRAWRVYEDVPHTLTALRQTGWRLAVVSNWDERLHEVLRVTGLAHHFEFILPSVEGPAPKPDVRLFQLAARRLGLPPDAIVHVGDSEREDVQGAHRAGFHARLIRRGAPPSPPIRMNSLDTLLQDQGFRLPRHQV